MRDGGFLEPAHVLNVIRVTVAIDRRWRNGDGVSVKVRHAAIVGAGAAVWRKRGGELFRAALALERVVHAGEHVIPCNRLPRHLRTKLATRSDQAFEILRRAWQ